MNNKNNNYNFENKTTGIIIIIITELKKLRKRNRLYETQNFLKNLISCYFIFEKEVDILFKLCLLVDSDEIKQE